MDTICLILLLASSVYTLKSDKTTQHIHKSKNETEKGEQEEDDFDDDDYIDPDTLKYETVEKGTPNTTDYRLYFKSQHGFISPYHDIPLYSNFREKFFNMVVEIPKGTNAKMSMSLGEALNPIKHEMKNGKLRSVHLEHVVPHHGYIWNHGAFPNTWENPKVNDTDTGYKGDGKPMDVVEIGDRVAKRGEIIPVKALGAMAFIDNGTIDYKIIAIDVKDPNAAKMHDIWDVDEYYPRRMNATAEWFKHHYTLEGKPNKTLAFGGEWRHREFAKDVIEQSMFRWIELTINKVKNPGIILTNTIAGDDVIHGKISFKQAEELSEQVSPPPEEIKRKVFITDSLEPVDRYNLTIQTVEKGTPKTAEHRIFYKSQHGFISPLHDIPLYFNYDDRIYNMIVEIPKGTNAKMAISLEESFNPIKQNVKEGKLQFVHLPNVLPHHGYIWNYGSFPNTWENPNDTDPHTNHYGDGYPLDVVDLGDRVAKRGEVIHVKVLGALGVVVNGKIDWKIIAINVKDPKAVKFNDIGDVQTHYPAYMKATVEWFEHSSGQPRNTMAYNGEVKDKEFAYYVITMSMLKWILLSAGKMENPGNRISLLNTISGNVGYISFKKAAEIVNKGIEPPVSTH
ncbi:hypothetical protein WDU94_000369 [Cyamophila willieti]